MSTLPNLPALPANLMSLGGSGDLVAAEYIDVVKNAITNHPRSLQKRIGPSELGGPCARRIGYKLAGHPEVNHAPTDAPWKPTVGTATHAWLEEAFTAANSGHDHTRWLVEMRVSVGEVAGVEVTGSADLYDRTTATVIDYKVVGPTQLKKYKSNGPGEQYRSQIHLYGRGFTRRNVPVERVMIAFLPRDGELRDAYLWHEPYDEQVALDALQRANGIALAVQALGDDAFTHLDTADQFCRTCPFYAAGSTDLTRACPGDKNARTTGNPFTGLLGVAS